MNKRECLNRVNQLFEDRRTQNRVEENRRRDEVFALPDIAAKEQELQALHREFFTFFVSNDGDESKLLAFRDRSLKLEAEQQALLVGHGYPADYLDPVHTCPKCKDEGAIDGVLCACYKQALSEEYLRASGMTDLFSGCSFARYDLSLYSDEPAAPGALSDRQTAKKLLDFAKRWTRSFGEDSQNLLFMGESGSGKTYLSVCIGCELIRAGKFVVYAPVQTLLNDFEAEQFGKKEATFATEDYLNADLLIIDDLGTEFYSPFVEASLYQVINTRMTRKKPTLISTNLSIADRAETYADRLNSRLTYSFLNLAFPAADLRAAQLKRAAGKKK